MPPAAPAPVLGEELASFLESGLSTLVGTRDAALQPAAMRAMAARVPGGSGSSLEICLPAANAARTLANLRENGRIAVTFSRPRDFRSIQIKGRCVDVRDTPESDRDRVIAYRAALADQLEIVGLAPATTLRLAAWPCVTVTVAIEAMFDQTPGPQAGRVYGEPAR